MSERFEKYINRQINRGKLTAEDAKRATSFADIIEKTTGGAIKSANIHETLIGSNVGYLKQTPTAEKYKFITDAVAKQIVTGKRTSASLGIWKQVNSPNWSGGNVQYVIEQLRGLETNNTLLGLDIEAIGSPSFMGEATGHFDITQIAMVPYKVDFTNPGGPLVRLPGDGVNVLVKPSPKNINWLKNAINKVKDPTNVVPDLSPEEYRSLKSLIAYAGDARFGDAAGAILKTNSMAIPDNASLKDYIGLIEKGLENLENKALSVNQAFDQINKQMFTGGYKLGNNFKYFTTNGIGYDLPAIREVVGDILPGGMGHIDLLQSLRYTHGDVFSSFYRGKNMDKISGLLQLDNIFTAVFGQSMQQAGMQAHYGIDDVIGLGRVGNALLPNIIDRVNKGVKNGKKHNIMGIYGNKITNSIEYQTDTLTNGTTLFSRGSASRGSDVDAVIDMNRKNGTVRKFDSTIYKNRTYELVDQYTQDGYYSVLLHNVEDDLYHNIGRKSKEELQTFMQRNFVPYSKDMPGYAGIRKYNLYDSARREYESLFDGESAFYKASTYLEAAKKIETAAGGKRKLQNLSSKELEKILNDNSGFGLSQAQRRNFLQFYQRFGAESQYIGEMISALNNSGLDEEQRNLAMRNFKERFDAEINPAGRNLKLPSQMHQVELFVPTPKGGERRGINATTFDTLESGIRSVLTGGVKESNANFYNVIDNFDRVVSDLVDQGVLDMEEGKAFIRDSMLFRAGKNKTDGVTYLSSLLANNLNGRLNRISEIKNVADLTMKNHVINGLKDATGLYAQSIDEARDLITYKSGQGVLSQGGKQLIDSYHIKDLEKLQKMLNLKPDQMPASLSGEIEALAKSLGKENIQMSIYVDSKNRRGLRMVLFDRKHAADVMRNGSKSAHAASVYMPLVDNNMLVSGGTNRANIAYAVMGQEGKTWASTAQQQVMFKLKYSQERIVDAFKSGNVNEATRVMNSAVRKALEPLSSLTRYADVADELNMSSRGANWLRTNIINISPLVNTILDKHKAGLTFDSLSLDQKNNLMRDLTNDGGKYLTEYGSTIKEALNGLNIHLGFQSTKTELIAGGMFSNADARWLIPMGSYINATREYQWQAQNYYNLDLSKVDKTRLNPIMMTDVAQDVYGGEINGIMVKTANASDLTIKELLGDKWEEIGKKYNLSTYESQAFIREDVAKQFGVYRRVERRIKPGSGLAISQDLLARVQNGGRVPLGKNQVITLGELITDNGGKPLGAAMKPFEYRSKYGGVIRGIEQLEDGTYQFNIDEYMPPIRGMKLMSEFGDKYTTNVLPEEVWKLLPEELRNADMVFSGATYGSVKRPPTATLVSELDYAISEYLRANVTSKDLTVGKMEKEAAEAHISQVISDMLGFKVGYKDYQMEHGVERVLTLPGMKNYNDITYGALDAALNKLGVKQGRVRYALANVRRSGIEEYAEFIGSSNKYSKFAGIHWGMREMEMIESRMARFNTTGGPDISPLYRALRSNAYNLLPEQIAENKSILNVVELARNKRLDGDYKVLSVEDVSNLRQQPARLGGNTVSDFTGTILDKSIAEGSDGFIIKLPGNIEIGKNRYVNELFMPALDLKKRVADGIFRPDDVQKYQLGIQEAIRQYSIGIQGDSKLAERAYGKLTNLVPKYILQAGNELVGSKGSMVKNTFEDYLKHSGRTIAQGFSVADMFDASGDVLRDKVTQQEGKVAISANNMRKALQGVGEEDLRELIGLVGGDASKIAAGKGNAMTGLLNTLSDPSSEGLYGLLLRNPIIGEGSVVPARYIVDKQLGDSASMVTVGLMTSVRADHDGDYYYHLFPWFNGKQTGTFDKEAYNANADLYKREAPMLQKLAEDTLESFGKDLRSAKYLSPSQVAGNVDLTQVIRSTFDDKTAKRLITEARLGKTVGPFSNMSHILRNEALTVGGVTRDETVYAILAAFGEQVEQKSISSKKLEELLDTANTAGKSQQDAIEEYVSALGRLRSTDMQKFDVDSIMKDATTVGILDDEGITGHYKTQLKYRINDNPSNDQIRDTLIKVRDYFSKGIHDPQAGVFNSKQSTVDKLFNVIGAIQDDRTAMGLQGTMLLREGTGNPLDPEIAINNAKRRILDSGKTAGNVYNELPVSDFVGATERTIGSDKVESVMESAGKMFTSLKRSGIGKVGTMALGVLGAWAVASALRGGPDIEQEPVQAQADQAPSSDGTYVDASKYMAGAPAGAGPTAYLSQRGTGYEKLSVNIRGNISNGMSQEQISQLITNEIQKQTGIGINLNITSEDNRETINAQWLQNQFASALKTGYVTS